MARNNLRDNVDEAAFVRYLEDGRLVVGSGMAPALLVEVDGSGLKVDCIVTPWTAWSACDPDRCVERRTRHVRQHAEQGGRTCNPVLSEVQHCYVGACTEKMVSPPPPPTHTHTRSMCFVLHVLCSLLSTFYVLCSPYAYTPTTPHPHILLTVYV
jgi:hypothetical protein